MHIIDHAFSPDDIRCFRDLWDQKRSEAYVNWIDDQHRLIDHRFTVVDTDSPAPPYEPAASIIERVVRKHFADPISWWAALQRQTNPHGLHIDEYNNDKMTPEQGIRTYTFIVPLETQPLFKAIIFREISYDNAAMIQEMFNKKTKISDISQHEDLDHMPRLEQDLNIADFLELDGIFSYQEGSTVLFNAKQWHTTSNWRRHTQFTHRDLLQIHVASRQDPVIAQ